MSYWGPVSSPVRQLFAQEGITDPRALTALADTFESPSDPDLVYIMSYLMLLDGDKQGESFRLMLEAHVGKHISPGVVSVLVSIYVSRANAIYVASAPVPTEISE